MLWLEGRGKRKKEHAAIIYNLGGRPRADILFQVPDLCPIWGTNTGINSDINQMLWSSWKAECIYLEQVRQEEQNSPSLLQWEVG